MIKYIIRFEEIFVSDKQMILETVQKIDDKSLKG